MEPEFFEQKKIQCSVIIATRGTKPDLLRRSLDSVYRQERFEKSALEVIVVIDGDAPLPELDQPCLVTRLMPESGGRPGLVRNQGIRLARGEWLAFLDDDDAWFPNKLASQFKYLAENPKIEMISSAAVEAPDFELPDFGREQIAVSDCILLKKADILKRNPIVTSSVLVRADILRAAGLFGDAKYASDWKLWIACLEHISESALYPGKLVYLNASSTDLDRATVRAETRHAVHELLKLKLNTSPSSIQRRSNSRIAALVADFSAAF